MKVLLKRVYDDPQASDGKRIFIDRLWPRGVKKKDCVFDERCPNLAPSPQLRRWYHADPEKRLVEFSKRYKEELKSDEALKAIKSIASFAMQKPVTLLTATKNLEESYLVILKAVIEDV